MGEVKVKVEKPDEAKLKGMGVFDWPIWEKEISKFDWHYDEQETCYFLEGEVTVETKDYKSISFGKGNLVTFPKGLSCVWNVKRPVKKHYKFGG